LIRKAFEVILPHLLPREVLYRTKEAFSDAVSSREKSWYLMIQEYIGEKKGMTERDYYSSRFDEWFGRDCRHVIPHYWMPSWSQTDDPSARTLDVYLTHGQDYLSE
jgi:asparagine synthase (glutamine-hydrolysing)